MNDTTPRFDRQVRAWLDLMPSEVPDRVVADVLQAAEATPQTRRPPWQALRRPMKMNRLSLSAAAAVVIVAVLGASLFVRSTSIVGQATPSPARATTTPSTGPSSADVPATLVGTWFGEPRSTAGLEARAGAVLRFETDAAYITQSNHQDRPIDSARASVAGDLLRLESGGGAGDATCPRGGVGTYRITLSTSGETLTLDAVSEPDCPARPHVFGGTWWRSDCRLGQTVCLGALDPGTYPSQYFADAVPRGELWTPIAGDIEYTVPDGWANDADSPTFFSLSPVADYEATSAADSAPAARIVLVPDVWPESQATPCSGMPVAGFTGRIPDLVSELRKVRGLEVGPSSSMTIDQQPATVVDLRLTGTPRSCPVGVPVVEYMATSGWKGASGVAGYAIGVGERERLILIATGGGDILAIVIHVNDAARFDDFVQAATPIAESIKLKVSFPTLP